MNEKRLSGDDDFRCPRPLPGLQNSPPPDTPLPAEGSTPERGGVHSLSLPPGSHAARPDFSPRPFSSTASSTVSSARCRLLPWRRALLRGLSASAHILRPSWKSSAAPGAPPPGVEIYSPRVPRYSRGRACVIPKQLVAKSTHTRPRVIPKSVLSNTADFPLYLLFSARCGLMRNISSTRLSNWMTLEWRLIRTGELRAKRERGMGSRGRKDGAEERRSRGERRQGERAGTK